MGNRAVVRLCDNTSRAAGAIVILIGCIGLLGWVLGTESLKAFLSRGVAMKANAAICLILTGSALLILRNEARPRRMKWLGRALAIVAAVVGGLTMWQHVTGADFRIDELLFREPPGAFATASPGRMGPPASTAFVLCGTALLLLDRRSRRGRAPSQHLALIVGLIALLPLIGYAYGIQSLYGISRYTGIAMHTALGIGMLAIGILVARPTHGIMRVITADDAGGMMARRLLLPAIFIPLFLGWLRTLGQRHGWFDESFGRPILILTLITSFTTLVWWTARAMSVLGEQRTRAEDEQKRTEEALRWDPLESTCRHASLSIL